MKIVMGVLFLIFLVFFHSIREYKILLLINIKFVQNVVKMTLVVFLSSIVLSKLICTRVVQKNYFVDILESYFSFLYFSPELSFLSVLIYCTPAFLFQPFDYTPTILFFLLFLLNSNVPFYISSTLLLSYDPFCTFLIHCYFTFLIFFQAPAFLFDYPPTLILS